MKADIKIIEDTTGRSIKEVLKVMARAEASALRRAAGIIKKKAKTNAKSTKVAMTKRSDKYNDTLIDAIRQSKVRDGAIVVHTMGTRKSGSGTFRTRFFEGGTQIRYQKTQNGVTLQKPRKVGKITATPFFGPAVSTSDSELLKVMDEQLKKYIEKAWENA